MIESSPPYDLDNSYPEIQSAISQGRRGNNSEAAATLEAFIEDHPNHVGALGHLAHIHELRDRPDLALPVYLRICDLAPEYPLARYRLAECYFDLGDYRKARLNYLKLDGSPFLEDENVLQRLTLCEPWPKRMARQAPRALFGIIKKFGQSGFASSFCKEVISIPSQNEAIGKVGVSGWFSYLNRHYISGDAWKDPKNPCDLCGGEKFETVFFYQDQKVVRCLECGLETVERKPPEGLDIQTGYYDRDSTIEEFIGLGWRDEKTLQLRIDLLKSLFQKAGEPFPQTHGSAFEIGFGQGHFLKEIEKLGYQVRGMETAPKLVAFATMELGLSGYVGSVETIDETPESYDLILAYHVLEHLDHPSRLFEKVSGILRKGGCLVIETPVAELAKMPFNKQMDDSIGYANYHHLHFFTPPHVRQYFEKHGFEVVGEYLLYPDTHPTGGFLGRKKETVI